MASALTGSHYAHAQAAAGATTTTAETTLELTYLATLGSWLALQADM